MKKKNLIGLLLAIIMACVSLAGCGGKTEPDNATKSGDYLVRNFKSDYSILIPTNASGVLRIAADELKNFIYDASGCELKIVTDGEKTDGKVISLGKTSVSDGIGLDAPFAEYGDSGYKIQTSDEGISILGGSDTATLYGVYKFLGYHIGFKAYSTDHVTYKKATTVPLWNFNDFSFKPDMPVINVAGKETDDVTKIVNCARMGQISGYWMGYTFDGMFFGGGLNCHSAFKLIPPSQYYDEHPEWFNANAEGERKKENLCLTNEAMRAEYVANLKKIIESNTGSQYFMLGNEDNRTVCKCGVCTEAGSNYGGASGVYARFLNAVSDDIDAWIAENYPERVGRVFLCGLGYFGYVEPPVKEVNGEYVPAHESVQLKPNVFIEYCTHDGCQRHAIDDPACETNKTIRKQLEGWSAVCDNLMIYTYNHNYRDYYLYFNNWSSMQSNMKFFKKIGVKYFYVQSSASSGKPADPLMELKQYLYVELAKDVNADFDTLVDDFITNYYGAAADSVKKFYTDLRANFSVMETIAGKSCVGIYPYMFNDWREKKYWDYNWLANEIAVLKDGIIKAEAAGYSSADEKRITNALIEMLVPLQYRTIQHYSAYFSTEGLAAAKKEYLDNCARAGITSKSMFIADSSIDQF